MSDKNLQPKPKKPIYKKWWFWLAAVILIFVISQSVKKSDSSEQASSNLEESTTTDRSSEQINDKKDIEKTYPKVGDKLTTEYFEIILNKAYTANKIDTGNEFADIEETPGNKFLILDITFKNIDDESRMFLDGSVYIHYKGKEYEYDKSETIMLEGWGTFLDQVNPLTTTSTKLVYKIPSEINGATYWEPGRNSDEKRFFCGNL